MNLLLTGQVAIVTGGSRGLGLATARALVEEGCRVAICARGVEALANAESQLTSLAGRAADILAVQADVSTTEIGRASCRERV